MDGIAPGYVRINHAQNNPSVLFLRLKVASLKNANLASFLRPWKPKILNKKPTCRNSNFFWIILHFCAFLIARKKKQNITIVSLFFPIPCVQNAFDPEEIGISACGRCFWGSLQEVIFWGLGEKKDLADVAHPLHGSNEAFHRFKTWRDITREAFLS